VQRASSDAAILSQLIGLHYYHEPITLDATWGRGAIWRGCAYQPTTRFDQRQMPGVDVVGAWADLPRLFEPASFQLVVWDPPHMTDGSLGAMAGRGYGWDEMYGIGGAGLRARNISHLYPGFLESVRQILVPGGMLLAKIADQVHGGEQQLQAVDFVTYARGQDWTVCELVPKMRQPGPLDPKWRRQLHIRKAWSYWICAHPGPRCTAVGVPLLQLCEGGCGKWFPAKRSDARTCGPRCEKRAWRARNVRASSSVAQQGKRTKTHHAATH
jgi:hypothetical protein